MKEAFKAFVDTIPAVADAVQLKETFWQNGKRSKKWSRHRSRTPATALFVLLPI